jgi:hypothetical protein
MSTNCFIFNRGNTEGWTIDQLYETSTQKKVSPLTVNGVFCGFRISVGNFSLIASADPLVPDPPLTDPPIYDMYLCSPDLSSNEKWKNASGFSVDIRRTITSDCGEPKPMAYYAQLQLVALDKIKKKEQLIIESNLRVSKSGSKPKLINHLIPYLAPCSFVWKPFSTMDKEKYQIKQIRIKFTTPLFGKWVIDCAVRGNWIIRNVCPAK